METYSQHPVAHGDSLYISPVTHIAGVNKIQVTCSEKAVSKNEDFCKQDAYD